MIRNEKELKESIIIITTVTLYNTTYIYIQYTLTANKSTTTSNNVSDKDEEVNYNCNDD